LATSGAVSTSAGGAVERPQPVINKTPVQANTIDVLNNFIEFLNSVRKI
jgi:hypothetical protein